MDHRTALQPDTVLRLHNSRGEEIHCVIERELGRGGSCIVYEAARRTDTGDRSLYRIKEFYPWRLRIRRNDRGELIPNPGDREAFRQGQQAFRRDFSRANRLYYSEDNASVMTNQLDVLDQNGTSYIVSSYSSRQTLAGYRPESAKECVMLVRQTAYVLQKIHRQGYLYLDAKPENILVAAGYQKQVQLFDFDSLFPMEEGRKGDCGRLSYSKGFAPIELQLSQVRRLGPHTDVYSIGAILFWLLFGRTPDTPDCEPDAELDFSGMQYDAEKCDGRLFPKLRDFFRHALAVYYGDRYRSMQEVLDRLREIETYADPTVPRIFSTPLAQIGRPGIFYGREQVLSDLEALLHREDSNCIFLTGMGGIGKSTCIRAFLAEHYGEFDTVLYVNYRDSLEATVSNDDSIAINTLRREEEGKSSERYFDRKLRKLRELVRDTQSILVLDNFDGEVDGDLRALISTGLKVVLVSRREYGCSGLKLRLDAVSDGKALRSIFEANLGRRLLFGEEEGFQKILRCIQGHTLVLELIAKQIAGSHLTIPEAAALTAAHGFSCIAPEKVDYEKDSRCRRDTIGNIIDALFAANGLSAGKKIQMKVGSLIGDDGIGIRQYQKILELLSLDDLNELVRDGWLTGAGDSISMHRVIREAVFRWAWEPEYIRAAEQFLSWFYVEIRLESTKNNYPRIFREKLKEAPAGMDDVWIYRKANDLLHRSMEKKFRKHGLPGKVYAERLARLSEDSPADLPRLAALLQQARDILEQGKRSQEIRENNVYTNLLYVTVLNTPRYQESYLLGKAEDILSGGEFVLRGSEELLEGAGNPWVLMKLYDLVIGIHEDHGRHEEAEKLLKQAEALARRVRRPAVYAQYYNLLSAHYDALLDGAYDPETREEELLLNKMRKAIDRTLFYSRQGCSFDGDHLYIKNLLSKAIIQMRSCRGSEKEIGNLMETARKRILKNTMPYADVRLYYEMVCGWYSALVAEDRAATEQCLRNALRLADLILPTELDKIETVILPGANMFFELALPRMAMGFLFEGVRICRKHPNVDSYARMKQELCDHFLEVGLEAEQYALCGEFIRMMDADNEEISDAGNQIHIPRELRWEIEEKTE